MTKSSKLIALLFLTIMVFAISAMLYVNSTFYIANQQWKYSEGTWIGDWLVRNDFKIKNRTIITKQGKAKIVYCFMGELIIENVLTSKRGVYCSK